MEKPPYYSKELDIFAIAEHYPHLEPKKFSALKYLLRAGQKEGVTELEDLQKLINCVQRRIKEIEDKG